MRGSVCVKVWTKKQQVVSLSSAESKMYAAVKTASEGLFMRAEPAPGCFSDDVLGQPQRTGQGEACRHAELVDTRIFQVRTVRHEESRHMREPSRLDDETAAEAED